MIQKKPHRTGTGGEMAPSLRHVLRDQVLLEVERHTGFSLSVIERYLRKYSVTKEDLCAFLVEMDRVGKDGFECIKNAIYRDADPNEDGYLPRLREIADKR